MRRIPIKLTMDLPTDFIIRWRPNLPEGQIVKKGWTTWIRSEEVPDLLEGQPIHPEDNKYQINFPGWAFELHSRKKAIIINLIKSFLITLGLLILAGLTSLTVAIALGYVDASNW